MAFGKGEEPARSPAAILRHVEYPISRDELVRAAMEEEAPAETINFLRCLHDRVYQSPEEVLRDFGEAEARFGMGGQDGVHRGDIGKEATAPPGKRVRHP